MAASRQPRRRIALRLILISQPHGRRTSRIRVAGGRQAARLSQAYQDAYPTLTGVQPTAAVPAPQATGDMIKNLILGGAY